VVRAHPVHWQSKGETTMWKRRLASALLAALSVGLLGAAGADAAAPRPVQVVESGPSVQAWDNCDPGELCVWEDLNGNGRMCAWTNADNDWWNTPVVCSWASSTPVESYWNRGTSTSFTGVELHRVAGYGSKFHCAPQGTNWNVTNGGVILRSHIWITRTCN
jgi:hypothetical protein